MTKKSISMSNLSHAHTKFKHMIPQRPVLGSKTHCVIEDRAYPGVVRFVGRTDFAIGMWAGVELDEPHGKNDGSINGKQYFVCKPLHGVFCRFGALKDCQMTDDKQQPSRGRRAAFNVGNHRSSDFESIAHMSGDLDEDDKRRASIETVDSERSASTLSEASEALPPSAHRHSIVRPSQQLVVANFMKEHLMKELDAQATSNFIEEVRPIIAAAVEDIKAEMQKELSQIHASIAKVHDGESAHFRDVREDFQVVFEMFGVHRDEVRDLVFNHEPVTKGFLTNENLEEKLKPLTALQAELNHLNSSMFKADDIQAGHFHEVKEGIRTISQLLSTRNDTANSTGSIAEDPQFEPQHHQNPTEASVISKVEEWLQPLLALKEDLIQAKDYQVGNLHEVSHECRRASELLSTKSAELNSILSVLQQRLSEPPCFEQEKPKSLTVLSEELLKFQSSIYNANELQAVLLRDLKTDLQALFQMLGVTKDEVRDMCLNNESVLKSSLTKEILEEKLQPLVALQAELKSIKVSMSMASDGQAAHLHEVREGIRAISELISKRNDVVSSMGPVAQEPQSQPQAFHQLSSHQHRPAQSATTSTLEEQLKALIPFKDELMHFQSSVANANDFHVGHLREVREDIRTISELLSTRSAEINGIPSVVEQRTSEPPCLQHVFRHDPMSRESILISTLKEMLKPLIVLSEELTQIQSSMVKANDVQAGQFHEVREGIRTISQLLSTRNDIVKCMGSPVQDVVCLPGRVRRASSCKGVSKGMLTSDTLQEKPKPVTGPKEMTSKSSACGIEAQQLPGLHAFREDLCRVSEFMQKHGNEVKMGGTPPKSWSLSHRGHASL